MVQYWVGQVTVCDVCREPMGIVIYDASIPRVGSWALMCKGCFDTLGCSLGPGRGQEYTKQQSDGRYLLTAGGSDGR